MARSNNAFQERVANTHLTQVCKCGTVLRAARHRFQQAAQEHFDNECSVIRKLGQPVQPTWHEWVVPYLPDVLDASTNKRAYVLVEQQLRQLQFAVPGSAPSWLCPRPARWLIEPAILVLHHELSDPILKSWETVTQTAILRMLSVPTIQPIVQTMIGLIEHPPQTTQRDEELVSLLHRITLGMYG